MLPSKEWPIDCTRMLRSPSAYRVSEENSQEGQDKRSLYGVETEFWTWPNETHSQTHGTHWVALGNSLSFSFTLPSVNLGILASDLSCSAAARKNQTRTIKYSLFNYQHSVAENPSAVVSDQKRTHLCRIKITLFQNKTKTGGG